ncbi:MAG: YdcF family protein [Lachnospiraceae bacterium]|jgi:uncharacterized SAM-binding protein YcdF (DUF218 family)|nr:YdcF family protein [Lachnospiraceae bacterium]
MIVWIASILLGIACIFYFIGYAIWVGLQNSFTFVWAGLGVFLLLFGLAHKYVLTGAPRWMKRIEQAFLGIVLIGVVGFGIILGILIREGKRTPSEKADYLIVLGAHVYGERMSANLGYRVQTAFQYLKKNPETKVILSGGQGPGEDISEAEAMRRYLEGKGIAADRILLEDTSVNTEENIQNSAELIGDMEKSVVIVSNDFHIFRAKRIAKKQGFRKVEGLGSKTHLYTAPNAYAREVIAVIKYRICGQI